MCGESLCPGVSLLSDKFELCPEYWREKYEQTMKVLFFSFLGTLSIFLARSKSNELPEIKVDILTQGGEFEEHSYSSGSFVPVVVGEKIFFQCKSKYPHRVISTLPSQVLLYAHRHLTITYGFLTLYFIFEWTVFNSCFHFPVIIWILLKLTLVFTVSYYCFKNT